MNKLSHQLISSIFLLIYFGETIGKPLKIISQSSVEDDNQRNVETKPLYSKVPANGAQPEVVEESIEDSDYFTDSDENKNKVRIRRKTIEVKASSINGQQQDYNLQMQGPIQQTKNSTLTGSFNVIQNEDNNKMLVVSGTLKKNSGNNIVSGITKTIGKGTNVFVKSSRLILNTPQEQSEVYVRHDKQFNRILENSGGNSFSAGISYGNYETDVQTSFQAQYTPERELSTNAFAQVPIFVQETLLGDTKIDATYEGKIARSLFPGPSYGQLMASHNFGLSYSWGF